MLIQFALLKSKVARRIFTLFLIAAIIPVTLTGIVSYKYVINILLEEKLKYLGSESKSYGMAIFDRILIAESQLIGLSENLIHSTSIEVGENQASQEIDTSNTPLFEKIEIHSNLLHLNSTSVKHLLDGKTLITVKNIGNVNSIIFSRLLNTVQASHLISAEVNRNYIFGDMDIFAGEEDACIIAKGNGLLNCSNDLLNKLSLPSFRKYFESQDSIRKIQINDKNYIIASWELFLKGSYNTDSWMIYYTVPSDIIYSSINSFSNLLIPLLLFTVLIISLISINQISKILIPIEKLTALTKDIAKRDFSKKIEFDSNDEFQYLGESFNSMSKELSRQFTVMKAMSNLDRAILTTMNKEKVVEAIFSNLRDYLDYNYASVILLDKNIESIGTLYNYSKSAISVFSSDKINVQINDINLLLNNSDSYIHTCERSKLKSVEWLSGVYSEYITTIAINHENKIIALIVIGHQFIPKLDKEGLRQLEKYTDRVNVALNAIEKEEKLYRQANFDDLTGLPNREHLIDIFNTKTSETLNINIAVLFIDLDRFKVINDSQGHAIGDKLLVEAAERIKLCIKDIGVLARYGGDEFIVLLTINNDTSYVAKISNKIITELSNLFTIDNYEQYIGASIGIANYPKDGKSWNEILQKADIAMYKAKQSGRGKYLYFSDTMHKDIREKNILEADLFHALEKQEIYMVYQPQIYLATGEISGAETLMRWAHNTKGNIRTDKFITYAEDSGFIIPLGLWAIGTVLKQCEEWQLEERALPKIAINISPKQLRHENFIPEIESLISGFDISTTNIEFEITESLFLNHDASIVDKLYHLNKLGISISIDDFGKGYSSLSYLKNLPVQTLKIDKLFIDDLEKDKDSISIVKTIIIMAKTLNKTVVAEGVETVEQLNILKGLNCDVAQGYYISKPKLAKDVMKYSKNVIISLDDYRSTSSSL
jgi:diguanylate cyclase (GGDEF)-like protein